MLVKNICAIVTALSCSAVEHSVQIAEGSSAVKWLEWILWFHLVALVVIAELFSLASMTIVLLLVLKKKWRWLFRH